ncbi:MAG: response regulator [Dehalococcoidales bacterium]|nr:response regulator [Dehalococcoidales bacterium]
MLIVDDDIDYVESTRAPLEAEGLSVLAASDSKQGIQVAREQKPDLAILDVMMSWILDRLRMSRDLHEDSELSNIPVIMVSSIPRTQYAAAFPTDQTPHVDEFLIKPVRPTELAARVKKMLASRGKA